MSIHSTPGQIPQLQFGIEAVIGMVNDKKDNNKLANYLSLRHILGCKVSVGRMLCNIPSETFSCR